MIFDRPSSSKRIFDVPSAHILVVLPNWVGDVVLATPTLAALREHFRQARVAYLLRPYVAEIVEGCGWHDDLIFWPNERGLARIAGLWRLARELRQARFDLALLLPNSFQSALAVRLGGVRRRVGYARDGRSWLLTDRLRPLKRDGRFVPSSVLPYYSHVAEQVGCAVNDRALRLGTTAEQERQGAELLRHYRLDDGRPYAVINAGAKFGASKCWPPERFAELCRRLVERWGLRPVLVGAPQEAPLMRAIAEHAGGDVVCCDNPGTTLGSLKVLMRGAALLVCNDTGPRHFGLAYRIPTVTLFGPTHQEWTDTGYDDEIKLQVPVECGPCQLPVCPLDHRCMTRLTTDMVLDAVTELFARRPPQGHFAAAGRR